MKIAFDLDGTLADITHRLPLIKPPKKDWPGFFDACVNDTPIFEMVHLCQNLLSCGHTVDIWSGRSDRVRMQTEAWLASCVPGYRTLKMRRDGDYRKDCIVKQEWLSNMGRSEWPDLAFDDRQQVVDMWRSNGIRCLQVAKGDF